jgi:hypothetical protein
LLLLTGLLCLPGGAAEKNARKNRQKLVPPPIISRFKEAPVTVAETGEFIVLPTETSSPDKGKQKKNVSVSLLREKGKKFIWKPSVQNSSPTRKADLLGGALSQDGKIAVAAERIGGENKPNSTRFVLFGLEEAAIINGFRLEKELISSIAFLPGSSTELIGIRRSSSFFKTAEAIVRINLLHKKITDLSKAPTEKFTSFAFGPDQKLFCTTENSSEIPVYDLNDLSAPPEKIKTRLRSPFVCFAGELLIAYGKEGIEVFRKGPSRWNADEKFHNAPEKFAPSGAVVTDASVPGICFPGGFAETLWYFRKDTFVKLKERTSGLCFASDKNGLLFAELAANSLLTVFKMPDGSEAGKPQRPNRLKPATRNGNFLYLSTPALKNKVVQIDDRGNVFLLDHSNIKRWKKSTVYIVDQTGFRR